MSAGRIRTCNPYLSIIGCDPANLTHGFTQAARGLLRTYTNSVTALMRCDRGNTCEDRHLLDRGAAFPSHHKKAVRQLFSIPRLAKLCFYVQLFFGNPDVSH